MTEFRLLKGTSGLVRTIAVDGRDHLVVPVVALMEGVIHAINAPSAEFVPLETLSVDPARWNEKPVVLGHPTRNGRQCSADDPMIRATHAFGVVRDAQIVNGKLACEAWLDPQRLEMLGAQALLAKLRAGEMVDVSVGAFVSTTDETGDWYGKKFMGKWAAIQPDHLAFLPESRGACSLEMGCGANRAAEGVETMEPRSLKERLLALFTFKGAVASQADLKDELEEALRAVTPGFLAIDTVYLDDTVVYLVGSPNYGYNSPQTLDKPDDLKLWRRSFTKSADAETVTLVDDAVEVEAVTTYEPKDLAATTDCPTCNGSGNVEGNPCEICDGSGELKAAAGARNSKADLDMIQTMHDHSTKLGASCHAGNVRVLETEKTTETAEIPAETTDDVKAAAAIPPAAAIEPGTN